MGTSRMDPHGLTISGSALATGSGATIHVQAPELVLHRGSTGVRARMQQHRFQTAPGAVQWYLLRALMKSPRQLCPHKLLISNPDNYLRIGS